MKWTPRSYQLDCVKFLVGQQHAGLFLDMGLGKTSITLAAVKVLFEQGLIHKVLLIAPIRTLYTVWPEEILKWDDFKGLTYHNWHESRVEVRNLPNALIHAINPESALTLFKKYEIFNSGFDLLIIDESSTFKNPASMRFKKIKDGLHTFSRRWILTGTPAPNGLEDLWSQIYILDRGDALGKYISHFRAEYCVPSWDGYSYTVPKTSRATIYQRISPLVVRLDATDHLDMPELVINQISVQLPPAARRTYKEMQDNFFTVLESEPIASPNAAVAGGRCRQIANGGLYLPDGTVSHIHDAKAQALNEMVESLQGNPLLVFYEFVHDVERIYKVLGEVPNLTTSKDPNRLVKEFNQGIHPVMIGHPSTIGIGLNLQAKCHHVAWMGVPWDLGLHDQANARIYRQGQEADRVFIHYIMAEGTLDEVVLKALEGKAATQQDLFDAIKALRNSESSTP